MQYIDGLADVISVLKTNRPSYGPRFRLRFCGLQRNDKKKNIVRFHVTRWKTTDNPVNESLNGWIKEKLMLDFT